MIRIKRVTFLPLAVLLAWATVSDAEQAGDLARKIQDVTGVRAGLVVHLPCGDGKLAAALGANRAFVVQGLDADAANVDQSRRLITAQGLYGRVSIQRWTGGRLPYVDGLVNLIVAEDPSGLTNDELTRVLCPRGVAYVKTNGVWSKTVKPWPDEIDQWTHWLHGADGNAVADDRLVGPPRHARWIAEPRWQRHHEATPSLNAMVSAKGRLFAIINQAPPGVDGLPDRWTLVARDAFNGTLLWTRPIPEWGWKQWGDHSYGNGRWNLPTHIARRLVAVDDRVYTTLGFNAPLVALDAATGETLVTYGESNFTSEILYHQGTLVVAVNEAAQGPGHIKDKPPVAKSVMAFNARTAEVLWKTGHFAGAASKADAIERVTHLTMVLGGGNVYFVEENSVVALDLASGELAWRRQRPQRPTRPVTYGSYYFTNLCSLVYHDGMLLFTEPDPTVKRLPWDVPATCVLFGLAADSGRELWSRDCGIWGHYNPGDIFCIDGLAWVHDGESFSMLGLNPRTGEVQRTLSTQEALQQGHHHRCYRNKATTRFILTGRRGVEFIDVESEENLRNHWVRGTCRYGILPCNGLLYAPPHPCVCYITAKLNGFWALAAENTSATEREAGPALKRGPAQQLAGENAASWDNEGDWPTYRHDPARSGCADTELPGDLAPLWETNVGGRPSSPVIADGRVLVASSETYTVSALNEADGKRLWSYTAGSRVDTPPTAYRGLALFGSADGWVTCLRATDGELVWRRRVAPDDSLMMNRGRLESVWPCHGSVLIRDGVAYLVAGRSSFLDGGIHVQAVAPFSGELLRQTRIDSIQPETGDMVEALLPYDMPPDALGALPDVLVGDDEAVYMRHLRFDPTTLDYRSAVQADAEKKPRNQSPAVGRHLMSTAGLLDDAWFSQTYWTIDGKAQCKLLVFDPTTAYGVKPFPGAARHSRAIFKPGTQGYTLFANQRPGHKARWSRKIPLRVTAMVAAGDTLFVAGTPDVVDPADPWAALEGRGGAVLWSISTSNGQQRAQRELASPPVFDGMAAAHGRLYVSTVDGALRCFGEE